MHRRHIIVHKWLCWSLITWFPHRTMLHSKRHMNLNCAGSSPPIECWDERTGNISHATLPTSLTPSLTFPHDIPNIHIFSPPLPFSLTNVFLHSNFCLLFFFPGKPSAYTEYFGLNRTTAELMLLKPIDRELYRRFDLVIKVRKTPMPQIAFLKFSFSFQKQQTSLALAFIF